MGQRSFQDWGSVVGGYYNTKHRNASSLHCPPEALKVVFVTTAEIAKKIEHGDHVSPYGSCYRAVVFSEVIVLAAHVLQHNAIEGSEQLDRTSTPLVHQTRRMHVPDLGSSESKAPAKIEFFTVEKEPLIKPLQRSKQL